MTVIRKEKGLRQEEWDRLKLDKTAQDLELGYASQNRHDKEKARLIESIEEGMKDRRPKSPRFGTEGCCGKGCNGCLVFWHDPAYEKARNLLAKKKLGEMFDKDMIDNKDAA